MFTSFMIFLNAITSYLICCVPILLLCLPFGLKINNIPTSNLPNFLAKITNASIWVDSCQEGWICGRWYIGYIKSETSHRGNKEKHLILFSTKKVYANILKGESINEKSTKGEKEITLFQNTTENYFNIKYASRSYSPNLKDIWASQQWVVDETMKIFKANGSAIILLCGSPGIGKSAIPIFQCKEFLKDTTFTGVNLVKTWNPTTPGDSFVNLYNKVKPTKTKPLIVVLEEIDGIIMAIHNGTVNIHKHMPIEITNKTSWNAFCDNFDPLCGIYKNVIVFLTSNQNISFFDNMDSSYMRIGRVHGRFEVEKKV